MLHHEIVQKENKKINKLLEGHKVMLLEMFRGQF